MQTATLSPLREQFETDGYVIARNVLDADLMAEARDHVFWLLDRNPGVAPEQLHAHLALQDPFWIRLVSDPRLLDLAEQFIGPNIALFSTHYICKAPFTGAAVLWHQDGSYWPLDPMDVVTFWLAVSETDPGNGCLRIIPRTQHLDLQEMKENLSVANVLNSSIDDSFVDESSAVDCFMKPGDVEIHHPNVIHGSNANTGDRWRMGLTIRYIPTTTRILRDAGAPFLLRGDAVPGINEYHARPKYLAGEHMAFKGCEDWQ